MVEALAWNGELAVLAAQLPDLAFIVAREWFARVSHLAKRVEVRTGRGASSGDGAVPVVAHGTDVDVPGVRGGLRPVRRQRGLNHGGVHKPAGRSDDLRKDDGSKDVGPVEARLDGLADGPLFPAKGTARLLRRGRGRVPADCAANHDGAPDGRRRTEQINVAGLVLVPAEDLISFSRVCVCSCARLFVRVCARTCLTIRHKEAKRCVPVPNLIAADPEPSMIVAQDRTRLLLFTTTDRPRMDCAASPRMGRL